MKSDEERRRHLYVVVAIVGGGAVVLLIASRSAAPAPAAATMAPGGRQTQKLNSAPNPNNPALEESLIAAREAALNTYDQSSVAERGLAEQYQLGVDQTNAARAIAFNSNATQLKETGMTTAAYQSIADQEAQVQQAQIAAQQQVAQQYASAQQTQAQGSFWGSLMSGFGGLLGLLGFNMAPTSGGVGYVSSTTGLPISSSQFYGVDSFAGDPWSAIDAPFSSYGYPPASLPYVPSIVGG